MGVFYCLREQKGLTEKREARHWDKEGQGGYALESCLLGEVMGCFPLLVPGGFHLEQPSLLFWALLLRNDYGRKQM